jgi:signal transduction histidine kinase
MNKVLADILFNNLISNSIRHNIPEGFIRISLKGDTLKISNSGHSLQGDPKELVNRFRKSDRSAESTGLGLSIVKKITQLYQFSVSYGYKDSVHTLKLEFPTVRPLPE